MEWRFPSSSGRTSGESRSAFDTTRGYLAVWDAASLLKAGSYTFTPYFVTKDGVEVTGAGKRTITITDKLSRNDFEVADEDIASTYSYTAPASDGE